MRKLLALFLAVILVFPLAMAALSLIAVSNWVLDRNFYTDLLGNERLYEVLLSEDLPNYFNRRFVEEADDLPAGALGAALREVVTPAYLRDEATRIVNQAFDVIEGKSDALDIYLNVAPLKDALAGEAGSRFARALASSLPVCAQGQSTVAPGGSIQRCLPSNVSVDEATALIVAALPEFLDQVPDQIDLTRQRIDLRNDLRGVNFLMTGTGALNTAIVVIVFIAGSFWAITALIGGEDRRGRLLWLGWTLIVPAALIFLVGLAMNTGISEGWVRFGLSEARFGDFETSVEFRQALLDVVRDALNTVANGFLMSGGVAGAIALGLVAWGYTTPRERRMEPVMEASSMPTPPPDSSGGSNV